MLQSYEIRAHAWVALTGKWGNCAIIMLVYMLLVMGLSVIPIFGSLGSIIISGPLSLGMALIFLRLVRGENIDIAMMFKGFEDFLRSFVAGLLVAIFTFLWTLLLIVPGIIAALSYSMTFFILNDEPNITPSDAIRKKQRNDAWSQDEPVYATTEFYRLVYPGDVEHGHSFFVDRQLLCHSCSHFLSGIGGRKLCERNTGCAI